MFDFDTLKKSDRAKKKNKDNIWSVNTEKKYHETSTDKNEGNEVD